MSMSQISDVQKSAFQALLRPLILVGVAVLIDGAIGQEPPRDCSQVENCWDRCQCYYDRCASTCGDGDIKCVNACIASLVRCTDDCNQ